MPQIAKYFPQVEISPLANPRLQAPPEEAFGVGIGTVAHRAGKEMQGVADDLFLRAEKLKKEHDANVVLTRSADFQKKVSDMLYNTETGLMNRKGLNANGMTQDFDKLWDETSREYLDGFDNDEQRTAFLEYNLKHKISYSDTISKHEFTEHNNAKLESAKASIETAVTFMVNNYTDPKSFGIGKEQIEKAVRANLSHLGEEVVKRTIDENLSRATSGVVERFIASGNIQGGKAYYEANKDRVLGDDKAKIEKVLETSLKAEKVQGIVSEVYKQFGWRGYAKGLAHIREKFSGDLENDIISDFKTLCAEGEHAYNFAREQQNKALMARIEQAGSLVVAEGIAKGGADAQQRASLSSFARQLYGSDKVTTVPAKYVQASMEIDAGTITNIEQLFNKYGSVLSLSDIKNLQGRVDAFKSGTAKAEADLDKDYRDRGKGMLKFLDKPSSRVKSSKYADAVTLFEQTVSLKNAHGAEITEIAKQVADLYQNGEAEDIKRAFSLATGGAPERVQLASQYGQDMVDLATAHLTKLGYPVTYANLLTVLKSAKKK